MPSRAIPWWGLVQLVAFVGACRIGFSAESDAGSDVGPPDAPPGFSTIGGTVTGLTGQGLALLDNGGDSLPRSASGAFTFAMPVMDGLPYAVTIGALPSGQDCLVANGTGIAAGGAITDVAVTCFTAGSCPTTPLTFNSNGVFTLPASCTSIIVTAAGGGGAGGRKNGTNTPADGGRGGRAVQTFTGQTPGAAYAITIGLGGTCASTATTAGGYTGGKGGSGGSTTGGDGGGAGGGGGGGAGSTGGQPGGPGGSGGWGGGGGGGGGDGASGNSGGAATTFQLMSPLTTYVIAGGGGGAGVADQDGDVAGAGGAACNGYPGAGGGGAGPGRGGGGGGGGACTCLSGTCGSTPTPTGGLGGSAGMTCGAGQNGANGSVVITFP